MVRRASARAPIISTASQYQGPRGALRVSCAPPFRDCSRSCGYEKGGVVRRGSHETQYRTPVGGLTDILIRERRLYAFRRIQRFLLRFGCFGGLREGDPRVPITSKATRAAAVR